MSTYDPDSNREPLDQQLDQPGAVDLSGVAGDGLRVFNTMGRRIEELVPRVEGVVRLYTCGPTVYNRPHIGNLRTFLFEDLLRRTLQWFGYQVEQVMNITDVEDKIIACAAEEGVDIHTFSAPHTERFFEDLAALGVEPAEHYPRATDYVQQMIDMIERLIEGGHAYEGEGSVYFRIESFADYGKLSRIDVTQVRRGDRVANDEYEKHDARDFALWKAAKAGEPSWSSPWGEGRPGWHVECSAMSRALLGDTFDIHCGGVDNIFPHHENEIAQSVCANGAPFARYWLHAEHLLVDGEKMSKSLGNQYTLSDLQERGLSLRALRYFFLSVHYRKRQNFTFEALAGASAALERLDQAAYRLTETSDIAEAPAIDCLLHAADVLEQDFGTALGDDLNVSAALGALFKFTHVLNRRVGEGITGAERDRIHGTLARIDGVLGVLDPAPWLARQEAELGGATDTAASSGVHGPSDDEIDALVTERERARRNKDFAAADALRDRLNELDLIIEDGPEGTRWRRR